MRDISNIPNSNKTISDIIDILFLISFIILWLVFIFEINIELSFLAILGILMITTFVLTIIRS